MWYCFMLLEGFITQAVDDFEEFKGNILSISREFFVIMN